MLIPYKYFFFGLPFFVFFHVNFIITGLWREGMVFLFSFLSLLLSLGPASFFISSIFFIFTLVLIFFLWVGYLVDRGRGLLIC